MPKVSKLPPDQIKQNKTKNNVFGLSSGFIVIIAEKPHLLSPVMAMRFKDDAVIRCGWFTLAISSTLVPVDQVQ